MLEVKLDPFVRAQFVRHGGWHETTAALALDPGNGSSGWALHVGGRVLSGQDKPDDVIDTVYALLKEHGVFALDVIVVEEPFFIGGGNAWKLARCEGLMLGAFRHMRTKASVWWQPKPATWRSVLGCNVSDEVDEKGRGRKDREAVERLVHRWVSTRTGLSLTTTGGKIEADRCMALGMLYASRRLARSLAST